MRHLMNILLEKRKDLKPTSYLEHWSHDFTPISKNHHTPITSKSTYVYLYKIMGVCPHVFDAIIPHWWRLRNVHSHEKIVPKFWAKTNLIGPLLPQQKETMEVPQNRRFCFDVYSSSPWAHLYRWKCQSIWAKSEVLIWRTCWGTHCELGEHFGNPLGT
jgi:hypothetical protein